ncbi:opioid growth factor receptor-related protein [uncultured Paludibaculum sp.]|uniref:opioid growth factor receptor-related protein n=1 Tax=uncultured Paludibaculum sp. TaxID=1765020 RepID=UPI002AAB2FAD|nr:opioid growth factor receptor-related protein [uncultured Paludibaculum sp.]
MISDSESPLLAFYRGTGRDGAGRLLCEIRHWTDERLEYTHDFIQWLFPLRERSQFNYDAPVLDAQTVAAFLADDGLRAELRASLQCMLAFYGLELHEGAVRRTVRFEERSRAWVTAGNHNHLRITRILKSLVVLGLEDEARAFFACLTELYEKERRLTRGRISTETFGYWAEALRG